MYMIAVCDDDAKAAHHIVSSVESRFQEQNRPVVIDCYTESTRLERRLETGTHYDVLLLDIDMPQLNGIELCRKFRAKSGDALVVFISGKESLVFQTFDVQPFRFIRKNLFSQEIDKLCRDLIGELERRSERWLRFQLEPDGTVYSVNVQRLLYVEADRKLCRLYTLDGMKEIKTHFRGMAEQLLPAGFIQIHRSYLVNPYYIFRIDMDTVLLDQGEQMPLSRNRRGQVKEEFFRWSRGG